MMNSVFISKSMKSTALSLALTTLAVPAAIIYEVNDGNTTVFTNDGSNLGQVVESGDTSTGTYSITLNTDINRPFGIASTDDLQTLNGGAITSNDVVTLTYVLDSINPGDLQNIGMEFGLVDGDHFRTSATNLFYGGLQGNNRTSLLVNSWSGVVNENLLAFNETSIENGLSVVITLDNSGYSFTVSDVEQQGNAAVTSYSNSGTWTGTEFTDFINDAHFYNTQQRSNTGNVGFTSTYSTLSIDVTPIPEPSSALFVGLAGIAGMIRRKR